ncbi:MAG: class I SAM-dependent DNA methyltransferase [Thermodesulfovibrionales bacterium]|nr:class I SAM-dependent DNA methyltransferase [Thermodesulfovibrionales bacterium]
MTKKTLDINTLEAWLWEAACKIRGEIDAPKYKDYILPLIFLKRLSDVFEDEMKGLKDEFGNMKVAEEIVEKDGSIVRFKLPISSRWMSIAKQTTGIGEYLTNAVRAIAKENPKLEGVINIVDFNATASGQRIIGEDSLKALIDVLGKYRLGLQDVAPDIIGMAYEYLLRKFAEGSGQSAGEFYTPREVAVLMSFILDPEPGESFCDPTSGSGGLLIKSYLRFREKYHENPSIAPLMFYGQEINHVTYAMAKMNAFLHDMEANIALGDTMNRPAFLNPDGSLQKFDKVAANPMWNQDFAQSVYENDAYNRFAYGYPPSSSADWGWIQHMFASLKEKGKMTVVLDKSSVSRGSGNQGTNRERTIRKAFIENSLIDSVILLPDNLFYNMTGPGIILVINKAKLRKDDILFINASEQFEKGKPKNFLTSKSIERIYELYSGWQEEEGISKIITIAEVRKNDYNLSPSRYVANSDTEETLPYEEAIILLKEAEEERMEASKHLKKILQMVNFR